MSSSVEFNHSGAVTSSPDVPGSRSSAYFGHIVRLCHGFLQGSLFLHEFSLFYLFVWLIWLGALSDVIVYAPYLSLLSAWQFVLPVLSALLLWSQHGRFQRFSCLWRRCVVYTHRHRHFRPLCTCCSCVGVGVVVCIALVQPSVVIIMVS